MLNYTIQMKFNKTNKNYRIQLKLKNMYEKLQNTNKTLYSTNGNDQNCNDSQLMEWTVVVTCGYQQTLCYGLSSLEK